MQATNPMHTTPPKTGTFGLVLLSLFFTLFFAGGVLAIYQNSCRVLRNYDLVRHGIKAHGKVIDYKQTSGKNGRIWPVVRYDTIDGKTVSFESLYHPNYSGYSMGQTVAVLYHQQQPQIAEIDEPERLWGGVIGYYLLGTLFMLVGGVPAWILMKRAMSASGNNVKTTESPDSTTAEQAISSHPPRRLEPEYYQDILQQQLEKAPDSRAAKLLCFLSSHRRSITVVIFVISLAQFAWHSQKLFSDNLNREIPIEYGDEDFAISLPTTWQIRPSDQAEAVPAFGNRNGQLYMLFVASKTERETYLLLEAPGNGSSCNFEHFKSVGWDGMLAEIGQERPVLFSDNAQFKGVLAHRVGYEIAGSYREDAYFTIQPNLWKLSFVVPNDGDVESRVARMREVVATSLRGKK